MGQWRRPSPPVRTICGGGSSSNYTSLLYYAFLESTHHTEIVDRGNGKSRAQMPMATVASKNERGGVYVVLLGGARGCVCVQLVRTILASAVVHLTSRGPDYHVNSYVCTGKSTYFDLNLARSLECRDLSHNQPYDGLHGLGRFLQHQNTDAGFRRHVSLTPPPSPSSPTCSAPSV